MRANRNIRDLSRESLWSLQTATTISSAHNQTTQSSEPLLTEEPEDPPSQPLTEPLLRKFNEELRKSQTERRQTLRMQSGFKFQRSATSAKLSVSPTMRNQQKMVQFFTFSVVLLSAIIVTLIGTLIVLQFFYNDNRITIALSGWVLLITTFLAHYITLLICKKSRFLLEVCVSEKEGFWFTKTLYLFGSEKSKYTWYGKKYPISDFYTVRAYKAEVAENESGNVSNVSGSGGSKIGNGYLPNVSDAENARYIVEIHTAHDTKVTRLSVFGNYKEMSDKCRQMTRFVCMMKELQKTPSENQVKRTGRISIDDSNKDQLKVRISPQLYRKNFRITFGIAGAFVIWTTFWIVNIVLGNVILYEALLIAFLFVIVLLVPSFGALNMQTQIIVEKQYEHEYGQPIEYRISQSYKFLGLIPITISSQRGQINEAMHTFVSEKSMYFQLSDSKKILLSRLMINKVSRYFNIYYPIDHITDFQCVCDVINRFMLQSEDV